MNRWYRAVRTLAVALSCSTLARAQDARTIAAGTRVRASVSPSGEGSKPLRCESKVVQAVSDTLLLSRAGTCPVGTYGGAVSELFVDHGSRWKHVAIGFVSGAAIGGIAARLAVGNGCTGDPCDDSRLAVGVMTIGGIAIGAAGGLFVGAVAPAGSEWGPARPVPVLRVAGVTVIPDIRISLRGHAANHPPVR
jgi:hypothetical protein